MRRRSVGKYLMMVESSAACSALIELLRTSLLGSFRTMVISLFGLEATAGVTWGAATSATVGARDGLCLEEVIEL